MKIIKFTDILPLPSSAYHALNVNKNKENQLPHPFLEWDEIPSNKGQEYIKLIGLLIARRVSYNFLHNLYYDNEIALVKKAK